MANTSFPQSVSKFETRRCVESSVSTDQIRLSQSGDAQNALLSSTLTYRLHIQSHKKGLVKFIVSASLNVMDCIARLFDNKAVITER